MSTAQDETKEIESEACALGNGKLLVAVITDILFSILFFFMFFCVSWSLNLIGKSWDNALGIILQLVVLLLISYALICSLIFALQSVFEFFKNLRIARNKNSKT